MLNLPYCTRLIPTGISAFVQECEMKKINFTTETDRCGAKPVWGNFTISTNGKELPKNVECYWLGSVVTMGNGTYSYNNEWQKMVPKYQVGIKKEMKKIKYDIEKSLDALTLQRHLLRDTSNKITQCDKR